jgi:hypothetical protein
MPRGVRRNPVTATNPVDPVPPQPSQEAPAPALSARATEMRRERRRRNDGDLDRTAAMKLAIPQDVQAKAKAEGKSLRWILDTRMQEAFQDDWDTVEGVTPVQANPREGTDERLVLCAKYTDWHEEDLKREQMLLDERDKGLTRGEVSGEGGTSAGLYVPEKTTNRISRERGL